MLRATVTGVHHSISLGDEHRADYKTDLKKLMEYLGEPDEHGHIDVYHKPIVKKLLEDIVIRGK